jgi:hypothetical protein
MELSTLFIFGCELECIIRMQWLGYES